MGAEILPPLRFVRMNSFAIWLGLYRTHVKRHVNIGTLGETTIANETYNPIYNTTSVLPDDDNSTRLWREQLDAAS